MPGLIEINAARWTAQKHAPLRPSSVRIADRLDRELDVFSASATFPKSRNISN